MALTKCKLGTLIEECNIKNSNCNFSLGDVRGISTQKQFIYTKANMQGVSLSSYKIVNPGCFAYVPDTSRRGDKISLAFNNTNDSYLVSSISVVFKVKSELLLPLYLYIYFNRPEFDRYSRYHSFGSAREPFDWEDMCDIDIDLPDVPTQQKYIDIYNGLLANQKSYESGLEDLKLTCDAYIENLRKQMKSEEIGPYICERREKNEGAKINKILGISKTGFINPKQDVGELNNYWIFRKNDFVYSPPRINVGSIGLYKSEKEAVCSPIYVVFHVNDENQLYSDYLNIWLHRSEFFRSTDFYAIGSVRNNFSFDLLSEVKIPIPDIELQKSIANIFTVYLNRKQILFKLTERIKNICPILIKGSIEEAKRSN